jgi:hypothetical protein
LELLDEGGMLHAVERFGEAVTRLTTRVLWFRCLVMVRMSASSPRASMKPK